MDFRATHPDWVQAINEDWDTFRQMSAERADLFFRETVREAWAGAQIVVWPEFGVTVPAEDEAALLVQMDFFAGGEHVIVAQVPTAGVPTLYPIIGDLSGWLSIACFAALTAWAIIHRRRQARRA